MTCHMIAVSVVMHFTVLSAGPMLTIRDNKLLLLRYHLMLVCSF